MVRPLTERRAHSRFGHPTISPLQAVLRPGHAVSVVNLSAGGALLDGPRPLRPGSRVFLQVTVAGQTGGRTAHVLRCAVASALVGALARGLAAGREAGHLRDRFEEELRSLVRARSIAVRDEPEPAAADVVCFDIPASASHTRARIEAVFEPARMLDGWTCQILDSATQLGSGARGRARPGEGAALGTQPGRRRRATDRLEPRDPGRPGPDRARGRHRLLRPD